MTTMTHTPTPEQFLIQRDTDEEDFEPVAPGPLEPGLALASVVQSLETVAAAFSVAAGFAEERTALAGERDGLREQLADLEAKHGVLLELVAEVGETVKPSTSKLANAVREVLSRWSDPKSQGETPDEEPTPGAHAGEPDPQWDVLDPFAPPAADASVEEWRAWARRVQGVQDGDDTETDAMNRSQIRTHLGVTHPGADG